MARLCDDGGRFRVIVSDAEGKDVPIRLGDVSRKVAEAFRKFCNELERCRRLNSAYMVDEKTKEWAVGLPDGIYCKLARAGLVPAREPLVEAEAVTLARLVHEVEDDLSGHKQLTRDNYHRIFALIQEYLSASKPVASVTPRDADAFVNWLRTPIKQGGKSIGPATLGRRIRAYRLLFKRAIRWGYTSINPFGDMKAGASVNHARKCYVPATVIEKLMAATPDLEFRAVLALCRYGALRCPSEVLALKWSDIRPNSAEEPGRIIVRSPKTEHYAGGAERVLPLFPELERHLLAWQAEAPEGSAYVIVSTRDGGVNWRTKLERLLERVGVAAWPKLFHNLRASRESELCEEFPLATVAKWLGHHPAIAATHYLMDPDADENFRRAAQHGAGKAARKAARREGKTGVISGSHGKPDAQKTQQNQAFCEVGAGEDRAQLDSNQ